MKIKEILEELVSSIEIGKEGVAIGSLTIDEYKSGGTRNLEQAEAQIKEAQMGVVEGIKASYPKSKDQEEHNRNMAIVDETVDDIKADLKQRLEAM